jgi:hypothetical protein
MPPGDVLSGRLPTRKRHPIENVIIDSINWRKNMHVISLSNLNESSLAAAVKKQGTVTVRTPAGHNLKVSDLRAGQAGFESAYEVDKGSGTVGTFSAWGVMAFLSYYDGNRKQADEHLAWLKAFDPWSGNGDVRADQFQTDEYGIVYV